MKYQLSWQCTTMLAAFYFDWTRADDNIPYQFSYCSSPMMGIYYIQMLFVGIWRTNNGMLYAKKVQMGERADRSNLGCLLQEMGFNIVRPIDNTSSITLVVAG